MTGIIAGPPRTLEQWESYAATAEVIWQPDFEAAVDVIVAPGMTAVPHFIDPAYPVEGGRT